MNNIDYKGVGKKINYAIYGLLICIIFIFLTLIVVFEWQERESKTKDSFLNEYHLFINKKSLQIVNIINDGRLWFLKDDIKNLENKADTPATQKSNPPVLTGLSARDKLNEIKNDIAILVNEIHQTQHKYQDPDFDTIDTEMLSAYARFKETVAAQQPGTPGFYKSIDMALTPLLITVKQMQRLHQIAYDEKHLSLYDLHRQNLTHNTLIIFILALLGVLVSARIIVYVRYLLAGLDKALTETAFQSRIIDHAHDAIISTDIDGRIASWNKGAEKLFGYKECEVLGRDVSMLYAEKNRHLLKSEIIPSLLEQGEEELETELQRKSGEIFDAHLSLSLLLDDDNNAAGFIGFPIDITERKLVEEELNNYRNVLEALVDERTSALSEALLEAEDANEAKSEFLSHMSHELRTPLNAIFGFAQMLKLDADDFNETQRDNIEEIMQAGRHLLLLINDVLDLAKIESGKLDIDFENVDAVYVIQQCQALITPNAEQRNITIANNINSDELSIYADYKRFKQVMLNILSNAVKYNTENGYISIDTEIIDNYYLRVSITDTGAGLTKAEVSRLFGAFERLNQTNDVEGAGIGLIITKNLVELMHGKIGVKSIVNKGTTFWVEIPLKETITEAIATGSSTAGN